MMHLGKVLSEWNQAERSRSVWFHLYDVSRIGIPVETGKSAVRAGTMAWRVKRFLSE